MYIYHRHSHAFHVHCRRHSRARTVRAVVLSQLTNHRVPTQLTQETTNQWTFRRKVIAPAASTARRAARRPAHTRAHEPWLRYDYFASFDSLSLSRARPPRRRPRRAGVGGRPRSRRRVARVRIARIRGRVVVHHARGWGRARARVMRKMCARCAARAAGDGGRRARGEGALGWVRARWGWVKSQARLLGRRPS